jgi:BASS family bile acid:Na+ symporter
MTPLVFSTVSLIYLEGTYSTTNLSISFLDMLGVVILILGIPLAFGMSVAYFLPERAKILSKGFRLASVSFFALLVLLMIFQNQSAFQTTIISLFGLVIVHNLAALLVGYAVALLFRLGAAERRTLSLETGIQNSGLGLLLIFSFFDKNISMALVAAIWGIWHLISGMSLALFWSKR